MRDRVEEANATEDQSTDNLEAIVDVFTDIATPDNGVVLDEVVSIQKNRSTQHYDTCILCEVSFTSCRLL